MNPELIHISDYDYALPHERIALYPCSPRDHSKLLIYDNGIITDEVFSHIPQYIPDNSLMIFNNTKVVQARLRFKKVSGAEIEIFCLEPILPHSEVQLAFSVKEECVWKCFVGNAKRWKSGILSAKKTINGEELEVIVEKGLQDNNAYQVHFRWFPAQKTFGEILDAFGVTPLPPYIHRDAEITDKYDYQTIYAENDGSVAAPTAGLHFTPDVFTSLLGKGVMLKNVTLHVSAGTFKPVNTQSIAEHHMHNEQIIIDKSLIEIVRDHYPKPIVIVGTTTARTIESLYWQGVKWLHQKPENPFMHIQQWDPYVNYGETRKGQQITNKDISVEESLNCVLEVLNTYNINALMGETSLLIAPGYNYRIPAAIITNFHQPKSTLLLLVAAMIGKDWENIYQHALNHDYRFLSYGDSCLIKNPKYKAV